MGRYDTIGDSSLLDRSTGPLGLRAQLRSRLNIPVVVAPMFQVSGPELVIEACRNGVIGAFPSTNASSPELLEAWLEQIGSRLHPGCAPFGVNLVVHGSNVRLEADLARVTKARVPIVITSVGSPAGVAERIHAYGGTIFADVATVHHARKALDAGADGLILLTAGAGGQTGWLNPFAFISEVRAFFDGPVAVAGCISQGGDLRALEILGADLGYMGTAFLASVESIADHGHKMAAVEAHADDIILTDAVTGIPGSFMRAGLQAAGLLGRIGGGEVPKLDYSSWQNVWSAGQGVGHVRSIRSVAEIIARIDEEYRAGPRQKERNITDGARHADGL